ncbi:MAG TPA: ATP-dependent Clp protease ATP-binding subunit, partial [Clostridiales bacterium]|nr:ATP-dependent Clp protease ATP-binding subunit [Clostridiales bacterium]
MAVLFLAQVENGELQNKGLCLKCAKELNIPQIKEVMEKMGITDEDIDAMSDQMQEFVQGDLGLDLNEDFEVGGAQALPLIQNLMSGMTGESSNKPVYQGPPERQKSKESREEKQRRERSRRRKFLDSYCENLTEKAKEGKIDNIIGREKEIYRVIQILNRRTKNNPCLIGEPGVGKTAIAEGIALKLAHGEVPPRLAEKELYLLDLTALIAG